jgi:hypothetical protein
MDFISILAIVCSAARVGQRVSPTSLLLAYRGAAG